MFKNITSNLLSFDKMISEQIIKLVYYIGLLYTAFTFVTNIYHSFTSGAVAFIPLLLKSIVMVVLAILVWRVICECIIIVFRMYSRLGDINKALGGKNVEMAIPGNEMLDELREAALKTKAAAAEKAKTLKSSISKDDEAGADTELKPAAKTPVKKPTVKKSATKKVSSAAKKTVSKAKTTAKKTTSTAASKAKTAAKTTASKASSKAKSAVKKTTSTKK